MTEKILLKIVNNSEIYQELMKALIPFKDRPENSVEFIVEGELSCPMVSIRYPGRKVKRIREDNSKYTQWANLLDFLVIPYENGEEIPEKFTFENILEIIGASQNLQEQNKQVQLQSCATIY